MPTCSQAKILTNLESGIQKRQNKLNEQNREFVDIHEAVNTGPFDQELYASNSPKEFHFCNFDQRTPLIFKEMQTMEGIKTVHVVNKKIGKLI